MGDIPDWDMEINMLVKLKHSEIKRLKDYRDCFGEYDETHNFCRGICVLREKCLIQSEASE